MSSEAIQGRKTFEKGQDPQGRRLQKSHKSKSRSGVGLDGLREVTVIEVRNPITHDTKYGRSYTDFEVCVKTTSKAFTLPQSVARRRYSDFVWLKNCLGKNDAFSSVGVAPRLPPKKILGRFEEDFLQDRMKGLQRFLRKVIEHNVYLSDKSLHLFLQSNMSVKQIDAYLAGKNVLVDGGSAAVLGEPHPTYRRRPSAASLPGIPQVIVENPSDTANESPSLASSLSSFCCINPPEDQGSAYFDVSMSTRSSMESLNLMMERMEDRDIALLSDRAQETEVGSLVDPRNKVVPKPQALDLPDEDSCEKSIDTLPGE